MRRAGWVVLVGVLVASACGGGEDEGDPVAFCRLLREGAGFDATDVTGLEELEAVAPIDIRPAVRELSNTSRRLEDIPDTELAELFAAATDPEAGQARLDLEQYAVDQCGLEPGADGPEPGAIDAETALGDLAAYITENFSTTEWADDLDFDVAFEFGRLDSVAATFRDDPDPEDAPLEVCNALAVYLYEIQGGTGRVSVEDGEGVLMSREGPDERCREP